MQKVNLLQRVPKTQRFKIPFSCDLPGGGSVMVNDEGAELLLESTTASREVSIIGRVFANQTSSTFPFLSFSLFRFAKRSCDVAGPFSLLAPWGYQRTGASRSAKGERACFPVLFFFSL